MLQEQISRKIDVLVDWAAHYINRNYPKHQQDHQTTAFFKSLLMTVDSLHFRPLLNRATPLKQLELRIIEYFTTKLNQTKETVLQSGNDEYTPMKTLVMFKIALELSYLTRKEQCMRAVSSLDAQGREVINKILNQITNNRRPRKTSKQDHENEVKKLKQQNKKLRLIIESLRTNQSEFAQKSMQLEKKIREVQYVNLQKDLQLQESNRKISQLQTIIKEISMEVFKEQKLESKEHAVQSFNLSHRLQQHSDRDDIGNSGSSNYRLQQIREMRSNSQLYQRQNGGYVRQLERQCRKSSEIVQRFYILRQMHGSFQVEFQELVAQ